MNADETHCCRDVEDAVPYRCAWTPLAHALLLHSKKTPGADPSPCFSQVRVCPRRIFARLRCVVSKHACPQPLSAGVSGWAGGSAGAGATGWAGASGWAGVAGWTGVSGWAGFSGWVGVCGWAGVSGWVGVSG